MHTYEVRPEKIIAGVNLISDILPFGRLLYLEVREAIDYAKFCSRSHDAVIRVYDAAGNVIELLYRFRIAEMPQNLATLRREIRARVTPVDSLFYGNFVPPFP
jgi:hypothetical protein